MKNKVTVSSWERNESSWSIDPWWTFNCKSAGVELPGFVTTLSGCSLYFLLQFNLLFDNPIESCLCTGELDEHRGSHDPWTLETKITTETKTTLQWLNEAEGTGVISPSSSVSFFHPQTPTVSPAIQSHWHSLDYRNYVNICAEKRLRKRSTVPESWDLGSSIWCEGGARRRFLRSASMTVSAVIPLVLNV